MKAWVVDTCVVLDIALNDAAHGIKSAQLLQSKLRDGLVICGVTFVELAPAFGGQVVVLKRFSSRPRPVALVSVTKALPSQYCSRQALGRRTPPRSSNQ